MIAASPSGCERVALCVLWRATRDGQPPCTECGHDTFEPAVVQRTEVDSTTVWVCTDCGREHTKHSPPCSRCGNRTLERREITVDDAELSAPGYRDLLTPRYIAALAGVGILAIILLLGLAGIINLPGLSADVPAVTDVPGNGTHLGDVDLASIESAFISRANELRTRSDLSRLEPNDRLNAVATWLNQRKVKAQLGDGTLPGREELSNLIEGPCGGQAALTARTLPVPAEATDASSIGMRLADRAFETGELDVEVRRGRFGLDLHALGNDSVSYALLAC
ncbi:MAG: hypothetical protein ABEH64_11485 [Salinirussus sp.]